MWYYVINVHRGEPSVEGQYKSRDAAQHRVDKIQGGETHIFASFNSDPRQALSEWRDEQVRAT